MWIMLLLPEILLNFYHYHYHLQWYYYYLQKQPYRRVLRYILKIRSKFTGVWWPSMLLNTYKHYYTEIHFIFSISVSMSRPISIYVVYLWSIFHYISSSLSFSSIILKLGAAALISSTVCVKGSSISSQVDDNFF